MTPTNTHWRLRNMLPTMLAVCCVVLFCTLGLTSQLLSQIDQCGYPNSINPPRSGVLFNESTVLRSFSPASGGTTRVGLGLKIRMWYSDEHALTLGVRQVIVKNSAGTTISTTPYTIETHPTTSAGGSASNSAGINVGSTVASGQQGGIDVALGADNGRPMYPALFITDLGLVQGFNPSLRGGDWQQSAANLGTVPNAVFGTWKGATRTYKSSSPPAVTTTPDADPPKNVISATSWGGIPYPPPGGFASVKTEGYVAEVVWNVDDLASAGKIQEGHVYRFQFMVHDGDQNKTGGDVGEACTIIKVLKPISCAVTPADTTICLGGTATLKVNPTGGLAPYTFSWASTPPGFSSKQQQISV